MSKVSIIVTTYLEQSKPYLDLCMRSIANLDYPNYETVLVAPPWYDPEYPGIKVLHPSKQNYFNSHALNFGAEGASPDSDYFFFLNDDVVLTRTSLSGLVDTAKSMGNFGIFMPIGNDQQLKYHLPVPYIGSGPYRLEALAHASKDYEGLLLNAQSPYPQDGLMFFETLCLYAVLVPRKIYEMVGGFDDSRSGQDDIDYTKRVVAAGYLNVVAMSSLVYHAGGVTSDITLGPLNSRARMDSLKSFDEKWGEGGAAKN